MSEMQPTETIAAAFFHAFYKKEWRLEKALQASKSVAPVGPFVDNSV
jgi:hypothetical protein